MSQNLLEINKSYRIFAIENFCSVCSPTLKVMSKIFLLFSYLSLKRNNFEILEEEIVYFT